MRFRLAWFRHLWSHLKGHYFCQRFHAPLFRELGGYGGTDIWGRRRKQFWRMWCTECDNHFDTVIPPKRKTVEQRKACAKAFGDMWHKSEDGDPKHEGQAMLKELDRQKKEAAGGQEAPQ